MDEETSIVCVHCKKTFPFKSILQHATKSECPFSPEELESLRKKSQNIRSTKKKIAMAKRYERNKDQIGKNYRKRKVERKERILKRESENSGLSGYEIYMMNKKKGKLNLDLLEICKSCKIEFGDTSILKHLKDPACRKDYDLEELEYITGWSEKKKELVYLDFYERKKVEIKQRSKQRWAENKESILNQRRKHLEKKEMISNSYLRNANHATRN